MMHTTEPFSTKSPIDTNASEDANWQAAVFKLDVNGLTDVILGADGTYRIGRVTEIVPAQLDTTFDQKLAEEMRFSRAAPAIRAPVARGLKQRLKDSGCRDFQDGQ